MGTGSSFPGGKWPKLEDEHSDQSSAEVKNGGAILPLPHTSSWHVIFTLYAFMNAMMAHRTGWFVFVPLVCHLHIGTCRLVTNEKLGRIRKEAVVDYFKVLPSPVRAQRQTFMWHALELHLRFKTRPVYDIQ
jgi:hypothetical protein